MPEELSKKLITYLNSNGFVSMQPIPKPFNNWGCTFAKRDYYDGELLELKLEFRGALNNGIPNGITLYVTGCTKRSKIKVSGRNKWITLLKMIESCAVNSYKLTRCKNHGINFKLLAEELLNKCH